MFGRRVTWPTIITGLWIVAGASETAAGQYSCQVPASVICQGCSTNVAISLLPGGGCRVSFSPARSGVAALPSGTVSLRIDTPAARTPRPRVASRTRTSTSQPPGRSACFVFNGQRYCE